MGGLTQATNHCSCNCCESRQSLFCYSVNSRHFKFGHLREVNRRKEVDRLSCESEGQVARDINWESGRRDFKIFWRRAETLACASRLAGPGHASHQQCQPVPLPAIQPPAQCSIVPQPTYSLILMECNQFCKHIPWYCISENSKHKISKFAIYRHFRYTKMKCTQNFAPPQGVCVWLVIFF